MKQQSKKQGYAITMFGNKRLLFTELCDMYFNGTNRFAEYRNWVISNFLLGTGVRMLELIELKIENDDKTYKELVRINIC